MSIQIGVNARTSTAITNNERIFLQSAVHSNMISLKSSLEESRLWFDGDLTFGRSNTNLTFGKLDIPFASFHPNRISFDAPFFANQGVEFSQLNVGESLNAYAIHACNIDITASSLDPSTPLLELYDYLHNPLLKASADGTTYFAGSIGIGTTNPQSELHVSGDGIFSDTVHASNLSVNKILSKDVPGTSIDFSTLSNILLNADVVISKTLRVIGGISQNITNVDMLYINDGLSSPYIDLSNIRHNNDTIHLYHDITYGGGPLKDILNFTIFDGLQSTPALTLTPYGALGIGTNIPQGTLDIFYKTNPSQGTSNLLSMKGENNLARFVVDKYANIGVGTTQPHHVLHLHRMQNSVVNEKSMVALYNTSTPLHAPILVAYSNEFPKFQIAENGSTTIGDSFPDPNWGLVSSTIKTPLIQTEYLIANPDNGCNIYLNDSHLSNVGDYLGKNMKVTEFVSTSNLVTNFFYSSNFEIPGLQVFNNANHFSISMASMIHKGSNIVFSPDDNDIYKDPRVFGKVRIYAPTAVTSESTVVGLNVIGPDKTISQVTSDTQPIFKLVHNDLVNDQTTEAVMKLENYAFRLTHSRIATLLPFQVNDKGIFMFRNMIVDTSGRLGLRLGTATNINDPNTPEHPFHMRGNALFQTDAANTIMFMNGATGQVGINTTSTSYTLHVEGTGFVRNNFTVRGSTFIGTNTPATTPYQLYIDGMQYSSSNILTGGSIGVGTLNPRFRLDVWGGDTNFTGSSYQQGSYFGQRVYANSNIGIGTTNPLAALDVRGTSIISSNVGIGTTNPLQSLHVHQSVFINSNVGIGTSLPLGTLHVQSGRVLFPTSVGIGTTIPNFPLHVRGDINFDGTLYQNGERYISSQWTTNGANAPNMSIYIQNSNVGIGLTNPLYGLHVCASGYFSCNVTFDSNVTVNGLLSTRGNIASLSDKRYKTNLTAIDEPMHRISQMTGYTYDRIDLGHRECGLIAQDVQKVLPEVVFSHPENNDLTISYGNLAALFVEGMKELRFKIQSLEEEIAYLKLARS